VFVLTLLFILFQTKIGEIETEKKLRYLPKPKKAIISDSLSAFAPLIDGSCSLKDLFDYTNIRKFVR
jgi:hypothetical protein